MHAWWRQVMIDYALEGMAAHSLRRCVFAAGLLCVRAFCSALLVLQASDACPGALQIIAHCDVQRAVALTGELDVVAVHERIEPSMVGAGYENVAGVQRVNRGDPFQRGILCAMSSELKFCMTTPL